MTILSQEQVTAICESLELWGSITAVPVSDRRACTKLPNVKLVLDDKSVISVIGSKMLDEMLASPDLAETAKHLYEENACKDDLIERLKLEAQIHAQESRTQKSIVNECLQAASGGSKTKGNWNGSRPVKERIAVLEAENARLREALEPFANPPAYVFKGDSKFIPANMPEDWIGDGWFDTTDFRKARAALSQDGGA